MAYVTVGLVALFAGIAYLDVRAVRDIRDEVFRERIALASSLAHDVDQDFDFLGSDLLMGAESLDLAVGDFHGAANELGELLRRHVASSQFFRVTFVGILDEHGQMLASDPPTDIPPPPQAGEIVRRAISENRRLILRSRRYEDGRTPFAIVVMPVSSAWTGGQPLAVVANTVGVSGYMPAVPGGGTGYSMEIIDADGRIIVSSLEVEESGKTSLHHSVLKKYMATGQSGVEIQTDPYSTGEDRILAITPLPSGPFYVILEQRANLALMVPQRLQNTMLAVGATSLVLALGVAWCTTRSVVRPIRKLRATACAFAQGGLDSPVNVAAQDELAELAEDIEAMRRQLKRSRDDLEAARLELEAKVVQRTLRLQETLSKIISAQEEERKRLARELHDGQSQALGALSVSLDRISHLLGPSPALREAEQARDLARSLLKDTRRVIYDLRPSVLDDMGLVAAIRWCAESHLERHGIQVARKSTLAPDRLPGALEVVIFRVAQEAIVNIERHAQARHASISLEQTSSSVRMEIRDDGRGFVLGNVATSGYGSGVGLEGMAERARLVGGRIEVISEPGKGTTLTLEVPLDKVGGK